MRLTRRFIIALTCAILVVLGINAFVRVQREANLFDKDMRRDSRLLGRTLAATVVRIWTTVGAVEALDLVDDANVRESHVAIRWLWLDEELPAAAATVLSVESRRALIAGQEVALTGPSPAGGKSLYTFVPVSLPDDRPAAIELRESLAAERDYVSQTIFQAVVATGTLVIVCGLLASILGVLFVGRPVRRLVEQARRIGAGDLSTQVAPARRDEIGELAREMNGMCERLVTAREELEAEIGARLATQEQLRHADRLTTVGKLAAGIAHEVGTPLNVITGYAQLVRDEYPDGSTAHDNAIIIAEQAHRVAHIIRQLLDFARRRTPQKTSRDLRELAQQVASLLESLAHKRKVAIEVANPEEPLFALVDAGQIQQVLTNLVVNGIHAMSDGVVTIELGRESRRPKPAAPVAELARITVEDRGRGIPEAILPRIFEPFFTTKDVGEGTGLGLSVAYGIIAEHGGWIEVESELGRGSRFAVFLPLHDAPMEGAA